MSTKQTQPRMHDAAAQAKTSLRTFDLSATATSAALESEPSVLPVHQRSVCSARDATGGWNTTRPTNHDRRRRRPDRVRGMRLRLRGLYRPKGIPRTGSRLRRLDHPRRPKRTRRWTVRTVKRLQDRNGDGRMHRIPRRIVSRTVRRAGKRSRVRATLASRCRALRRPFACRHLCTSKTGRDEDCYGTPNPMTGQRRWQSRDAAGAAAPTPLRVRRAASAAVPRSTAPSRARLSVRRWRRSRARVRTLVLDLYPRGIVAGRSAGSRGSVRDRPSRRRPRGPELRLAQGDTQRKRTLPRRLLKRRR
jgi:hypothetical protein